MNEFPENEPSSDDPTDGEPPAEAEYAGLTEAQVREFVEQIPAQAEKIREQARKLNGAVLDYSAESIPRLDDLIAENWPDGPPALIENMVLAYGCYLGETIRALHGGDWCHSDEMGFHLDIEGMKVFPFAKVRRRFLNGKEDSLGFFYQVVWTELSKRQNPFLVEAEPVPIADEEPEPIPLEEPETIFVQEPPPPISPEIPTPPPVSPVPPRHHPHRRLHPCLD